ncbi:MAG: 1,4-dihydroxy-2-naphthoate polyprenyltransferase [Aliivibrio sp.]|uniref:1,4-dihydroxy-2-naphthoate polyprenyltransferase n=1 Tax=Aliivibrio sp. TaxID=1872443 RepID=UPI001A51B21C|nr:1,4-dihydroxy-2-naphthoate polyprenyltransferase [Aliivibrio sp.]
MKPTSLSVWISAIRLKTLPLALASITSGSALAYWQHHFSLSIAFLALCTATLLQILSNLANDYGDAVKGTDNDERLGPERAMQSGLISAATMKKALVFNVILTLISGISLVMLAFNNLQDIIGFIGLGIMAIIAAITYTVGNKPYGYRGMGDFSVLIFFGLLGVAGSYYLHTGSLNPAVFLPALSCGLLAAAVLNINNLRDIDNDTACGKLTLVVKMGAKWGRQYHLALLSSAMLGFALFAAFEVQTLASWLFLLALPLIIKHGFDTYQAVDGEAIKPMMGTIVKCALITNLLFSVGIVIS